MADLLVLELAKAGLNSRVVFILYGFNPCPAELAFANSVDPDQLASEEAN